jgi:hypothetical protein
MQKFSNLVLEANKKLKLADHIAYVTYPLLKETKLLLTILENTNKSLILALNAYLHYDHLYKRISHIPESLGDKLDIFERSSAKRYNLEGYKQLILEINEILKKHKDAPVAFVKKDKLVICSKNYKIKTLEIEDAKMYLSKAKPFILRLHNILKQEHANKRR